MWKFCGKAQFRHSFGQFARNYAETVPFRKISISGNQVKLQYFLQWALIRSICFLVVIDGHLKCLQLRTAGGGVVSYVYVRTYAEGEGGH